VGVVRITGFASLYNNDPYILPAEVQDPPVTGFASQKPRLSEAGAAKGFDASIGLWGSGTLEITAGARAEIEDAVLVGDNTGATGNLVIDGIDSFLGNGGSFDFGATTETEFHMTIIGRQGTGNLTLSNGATMATQVFAASGGGGTQGAVAASLGSTPYTLTPAQTPDAGGSGTATITGNGSKWTIAGSMQVGGFDNGTSGGVFATGGDLEGDDTHYGSQAGIGNLYVNDGGLMEIHNAIGVPPTDTTTALVLAIGQFGTVRLAGGTIQVGSVVGGSQNQGTSDAVQVINDGLITGTGRINTGVFRNRYFGTVRVDAGQSLVIDSNSELRTVGGATPLQPLTNFGMIQVLGTSQAQAQLEFVRGRSDPRNGNILSPFLNLPLGTADTPPPPQPAFTGGQISAQFANLRFGSGLQNQSMLAFTAGTNNITGRVVTLDLSTIDPSADDADAGDTAQVLVSGPGTTAVFHDDLAFAPLGELNLIDGGKVVVLNQHSFTMAGNLSIELSFSHPSLITVGGDVGIGPGTGNNDLSLSLANDVLSTIKHGDAFQIIAHTGDIGGVNLTIPTSPIIDYTMAPLFTDIDVSPDVFALHNLVAQVQFAPQGVYVVFLDPTMVGPGAGAIAPDFNGDGVVDLADFAIWQMHVGQMSGASVLDGDTDGDGDVDGVDFLMWQRNVGRPMPWTGSGSGSGSGSSLANVPEPASLMMLAFGGSLAIAFGRRRSK
jgi:T5SS/PEP-CTERM-associated repeat protein